MNNVQYLKENIKQVKVLIADTERRMSAGEGWLDAQLGTFKRHLDDLRKQLAESTKPKKRYRIYRSRTISTDLSILLPGSPIAK